MFLGTSSVDLDKQLEIARNSQIEKVRETEDARQVGVEKQKLEILEQQAREEQLSKSLEVIQDIINFNRELSKTEKENLEWQLYVDCGRLPNPFLCDQMNTYLHLWSLKIQETTIEDASKRTYDVMKLLYDLEDLIDNAADDENKQTVENWKWIYSLLNEFQTLSLNVATYKLLKCVEKNMNRVDIPTAEFNFRDDYMDISVWLRVNLPIPLSNPRRPPKPRVDIPFPRFVKSY